ncbi:hypothetical protein B7494_g3883 [Chlorociboria aeruginascens]|nr:hypothetical protein B7494_g3883 [Chlorociboria aeruginascens]
MATSNEKLMAGVLKQVNVQKLDFEQLAADIGVPTAGAAAKRWSRFKVKLRESTGTSPIKPSGVQKNTSPAKSLPRAQRKGRKEGKEEAIDIPVTLPKRTSGRKAQLKQEKMEFSDEDTSDDGGWEQGEDDEV